MFEQPFEFVSFVDLMNLVRSQITQVPRDVDLVVGIPRSGMIPAYAIGLMLNVEVVDIHAFVAGAPPGHGRTRVPRHQLFDPRNARRILVVDDSVATGDSLRAALTYIRSSGYTGNIVTCAAIVAPDAVNTVDVQLSVVPLPRAFEWNIFHHGILERSCVDFDGVLCANPTESENDDGARYLRFLQSASPLYVPTRRIAHIVSARLEKYRPYCEQWLERHKVDYDHLHLLDVASKAERIATRAHHGHKAAIYNAVGASLFIESDASQAVAIAQATGRPVVCTDLMQAVSGSGTYIRHVPQRLAHAVPVFARRALRYCRRTLAPRLRAP